MRSLVALVAALALFGAAPSPQPSRPASVTVPIRSEGDHLFTTVTIDGTPLRFVVDTSGGEILDARAALKLDLRHGREIRVSGVGDRAVAAYTTRIPQLALGSATLANIGFVVLPIGTTFGVAEGEPIDGVIGPALLRRFTVTIDATGGTMSLAPRGSGPLGDLPLSIDDEGHPAIPCRLDAIDTTCQLDTGSRLAVTLTRPFLAAHPEIAARATTAVGVDGYGIGGPARGRLGPVSVTVAGQRIDVIGDFTAQTDGAFAHGSVGGNVGERLLRRFVVTYDLARGRASFTPSTAFAQADHLDRSGMFLIRQDDQTVVLDVRPGTPAAAAGVKDGDVLLSLDGREARALSLRAIREALSDPTTARVALRVRDGDDERAVSLALTDYVSEVHV